MQKSVYLYIFLLFSGLANAQTSIENDSTALTSNVSAVVSDESSLQILEKAADDYSKKKYDQAATLYESVIKQHGGSADLHYNLGNAYFKSNKMAPAILHFEKALRLDPSNDDALFNLQMCNTRIVDQITPVGKFLFARWYESLGLTMGSNAWARLSILMFLLFTLSLSAYYLARRRWLKKSGFYIGILSIFLSILAFVYSWQAKNRLTKPDEAILFTLSVTVKSSPDESGTDLFVIHEGIKMKIRSKLGNWSEIELADGNSGWLPSKDFEII